MVRRPAVLVSHWVMAALFASAGCTGAISAGPEIEEAPERGGEGGASDTGGTGGAASACRSAPTSGAARWRRLTKSQYANTVRDLLNQPADTAGFVDDSRTGPFRTNSSLPVQENDVASYAANASTLATKAVTNLHGLLGDCDTASAPAQDKCAADFIRSFGARAFRRPLGEEEVTALTTLYTTGTEESFAAGIRLVVQGVLQAPSFLYMIESGNRDTGGLRKLTGYELATRLAYVLTDTMPNPELTAAARDGKLDEASGVRSWAEKLLTKTKYGQVGDFVTQLLAVESLTDATVVSKAPKYATFDAAMRTAMRDEPRSFADYVMNNGRGTVAELLAGEYVFPKGPLASVYGSSAKADADGRAVMRDGTRKGILTLAGPMAVHPKQPSPSAVVNRGHFVRQDLLCQTVPPPNQAVSFELPPGADKLTAQQLLRAHQENPTCVACHKLMDSIGFGFETYDPLGAYRSKDDAGNVIDSSGEVVGIEGDGRFANAGEMAELLAKSPEVRSCMSTQWFRFAIGREPGDADQCAFDELTASLTNGDGSIKDAILTLIASDSFRFNGGVQ